MGLFSVDVELAGPAGRETVAMLVDTGATYSAVSGDLAGRLGLTPTTEDLFEFADGRTMRLPIAEARIRIDGRESPTLVIITEGRPLLGAYALEGLRLGVDPQRKRLVPVTGFLGELTTIPQPLQHATAIATLDRALPADRHPVLVYLARLGSPNARRAMRGALEKVAALWSDGRYTADTLPWAQLRYPHTQAIRTKLAECCAPATANLAICALRQVLRECWRLGEMDAETYQRAADLHPVRGERLPAGRALSRGELAAIYASCKADRTAAGTRDAALLSVLYGAGLRRSEAVALDLENYDADTGALRVLHAKGRKQRQVYVPHGGGMAAVAAWLVHRGADPGPLFFPVSQRGGIEQRRMTAQVCRWVLRKRARQAGITDLPSPHDLRRSHIGDLLDAGADAFVVQKMVGHSSPVTTGRYDRRPDAAKRKAASLLHIPY
jgi:clan AA aspartic protease